MVVDCCMQAFNTVRKPLLACASMACRMLCSMQHVALHAMSHGSAGAPPS